MKKKNVGSWIVLVAWPLLLVALFFPVIEARGPYYLSLDPNYAYLMNAFTVLDGKVPGHRDHPGTTVQELGAIALKVKSPLSSRNEILRKVLNDPERELRYLGFVLNATIAFLIFLAGLLVAKAVGSATSGVLFQILPFASATTWDSFGQFNPDLPVLGLGMFFIALAMQSPARPRLLGVSLGATLATKVTGLPLALVPFLLLQKTLKAKIRTLLVVFAFALLSGFLFTLPLFFNWKESAAYILNWFWQILSHDGKYGSGEIGFPSLLDLALRAVTICLKHPILPASVTIGAFLLRRYRRTVPYRLVLACSGVVVTQVLIVAKHPGYRYLLPAFGCASLLVCLGVLQIFKRRQIHVGTVMLVSILTLFFPMRMVWTIESVAARNADLAAIERTAKKCEMVCFKYCGNTKFGLYFGNNYVAKRYLRELQGIYGSPVTYNPEYGTFAGFDSVGIPKEVARKKPLCLKMDVGTLPSEVLHHFPDAKEILRTHSLGSVFRLEAR